MLRKEVFCYCLSGVAAALRRSVAARLATIRDWNAPKPSRPSCCKFPVRPGFETPDVGVSRTLGRFSATIPTTESSVDEKPIVRMDLVQIVRRYTRLVIDSFIYLFIPPISQIQNPMHPKSIPRRTVWREGTSQFACHVLSPNIRTGVQLH